MAAFQAEPDIHEAVTAFCEATVNTASSFRSPPGFAGEA
jgi:hypothetical protein